MNFDTKLTNARTRAEKKIEVDAVDANEIYEWYGKPKHRSDSWNPLDLAKTIRNMQIPPTKKYFEGAYDEYEHDFSLLADYLEAMYAKSNTGKSLMVIRKDDFSELVNLLVDWQFDHKRGWDRAEDLEKDVRKLRDEIGEDPLEKHFKSTAWNLNRIANVLESQNREQAKDWVVERLKRGGK